MKKSRLFWIAALLLLNLLPLNGFAQDYAAQWHLPEGAKARLGRGSLNSIKISPDSTRVVVSTAIGIWIYDTETQEVVSLFTETQAGDLDGFLYKRPPEAVTFSPDAAIVATVHGKTVYVWDTFTGNAFAMLREHPDTINAVTLSPDGAKLATAGGDWNVHLWEVQTGKYIRKLAGHPSSVNAVAFSPDGNILASAGSTLRLWDANTGDLLYADDNKDLGSIALLAFSPDGTTVATGGGWDHTVRLWDTKTGTLRVAIKGHTEIIRDMAFSPDGATLVTASGDKTVRLWDVGTGTEQRSLPTPDDAISPFMAVDRMLKLFERGILPAERDDVQSVKFSQDGGRLLTVSSDGSLHLWNVETGRYETSFALGEHTNWSDVLSFSPDSKYLVSNNGGEQRARVWSTETFTQHAILTVPKQIIGLAFSPDLKKLTGRNLRDGTHVWDATTQEKLSTLQGVNRLLDNHWPLIFSPDSRILASTNITGPDKINIRTWETDTGAELFTLEGHTARVSKYAFSPDSRLLVSGSEDGAVILWDTDTGQQLQSLTGHTERISALTFTADSQRVVSASRQEVRLWEVQTGRSLGVLEAGETIIALAPSPDGRRVAGGSEAGTIQIWALTPNYEQHTKFAGHHGAIHVLMFSPDGKTLASGSDDGTILIWDYEKISQGGD